MPSIWIMLIPILVAILTAPRIGVFAIVARRRRAAARELLEDALKLLLEHRRDGRKVTRESVRAALHITPRRAAILLSQLEEHDLIRSRGTALRLSRVGQRWALRVLRAHRLWERYLADEARMPLQDVHGHAQRREHLLSTTQVDDLEAALGYPAYDPHGDPIPSPRGTLRQPRLTAITALRIGQPGRIGHLEDEPASAFQAIHAAGIRLGHTLFVLERGPGRILLSDGVVEYSLAAEAAANIFVLPIDTIPKSKSGAIPLGQLPKGATAEVLALDGAVQGFTRRRFLDLGVTPGTIVRPELDTFFGDPRAYRVRGTLIALRKDQADLVWVEPIARHSSGHAIHRSLRRGD